VFHCKRSCSPRPDFHRSPPLPSQRSPHRNRRDHEQKRELRTPVSRQGAAAHKGARFNAGNRVPRSNCPKPVVSATPAGETWPSVSEPRRNDRPSTRIIHRAARAHRGAARKLRRESCSPVRRPESETRIKAHRNATLRIPYRRSANAAGSLKTPRSRGLPKKQQCTKPNRKLPGDDDERCRLYHADEFAPRVPSPAPTGS